MASASPQQPEARETAAEEEEAEPEATTVATLSLLCSSCSWCQQLLLFTQSTLLSDPTLSVQSQFMTVLRSCYCASCDIQHIVSK